MRGIRKQKAKRCKKKIYNNNFFKSLNVRINLSVINSPANFSFALWRVARSLGVQSRHKLSIRGVKE